jgi:hypothetical protein
MNLDKWKDVVSLINKNYKVLESSTYHLEKEGGVDIEYIIFEGPLGAMKLEFITKPLVIGKKVVYSNRIGSESKVDYKYSEKETSHKMKAYKWDDSREDWIDIDASSFAG